MDTKENAYPQGSHSNGLTKRELFAAMAMQGLLAAGHPKNPGESTEIAPLAVAYADALLGTLAKVTA